MLDEWYSPREIVFTRQQVIWLLRNVELLREGKYPSEPKTSGYIDSPIGKRRVKSEATFVKPISIIAEVDWRLTRTGVDGKLLVAEVQAEYLELSHEAKQALNYVSGWRRRRMSYQQWLRNRRYRSRKLTKMSI